MLRTKFSFFQSLKKLQSLIKKAEKIENEKRGQSYDRDSSTYHPTKSWRQSSSDFRYSEDRNRRSKYFLDPSKSYQTKSDYQRMFKRPSDSPPPVERSDDSNVLPSESRHSHLRSNYDAGQRDNSGLNRDKYGRHSNRESGTAYVPTWKKKTASSEEQTEKLRVAHSMDEEKNRKNTTKKTSGEKIFLLFEIFCLFFSTNLTANKAPRFTFKLDLFKIEG